MTSGFDHPLHAPLRDFAFGLPEAYEDHPWGESVAKVAGKVFVFFGMADATDPLRFTVKLPISNDDALALQFTTPAGYGLDRGRWVTVTPPDDAPADLLLGWIEESYRAVAPKVLVARLEEGSGG